MSAEKKHRPGKDRAVIEVPAWRLDNINVAPDEAGTPDLGALLADVDRNADGWWRSCALAGIRHLAALGEPFTAHDVATLGVPDPDHPNRWGALFSTAAHAQIIRPVGVVRSDRRTTHRALVRLWVGAQQNVRAV